MKSAFFTTVIALVMMGCAFNSGDIGKDNALQYVREAIGNMEVKSIEVVHTDSLLCDVPLMFQMNGLLKAESAFLEDKISADSLQHAIDKILDMQMDIMNTWMYGIVVNDSLKNVPGYAGAWRRVHTVQVTLPSTETKQTRVLMDSDGITPRCLENEFVDIINKYGDDIHNVQITLNSWK